MGDERTRLERSAWREGRYGREGRRTFFAFAPLVLFKLVGVLQRLLLRSLDVELAAAGLGDLRRSGGQGRGRCEARGKQGQRARGNIRGPAALPPLPEPLRHHSGPHLSAVDHKGLVERGGDALHLGLDRKGVAHHKADRRLVGDVGEELLVNGVARDKGHLRDDGLFDVLLGVGRRAGKEGDEGERGGQWQQVTRAERCAPCSWSRRQRRRAR